MGFCEGVPQGKIFKKEGEAALKPGLGSPRMPLMLLSISWLVESDSDLSASAVTELWHLQGRENKLRLLTRGRACVYSKGGTFGATFGDCLLITAIYVPLTLPRTPQSLVCALLTSTEAGMSEVSSPLTCSCHSEYSRVWSCIWVLSLSNGSLFLSV